MMIYLLLTILLCTVSDADEDFIDAIITSAVQEAYKVPLRKTSTRDESNENLPASGNVFAFIQKQKNVEDRIAQDGFKYLCLIRELISKSSLNVSELQRSKTYNSVFYRNLCDKQAQSCRKFRRDKYRTANGLCNNLQNPKWGTPHRAHARYLHPEYDDGYNSPKQRGKNGGYLRSPREISNKVLAADPITPSEIKENLLLFAFGQFIDHDLTFTPIGIGEDGNPLKCCGKDGSDAECFPIKIKAGDPRFSSNCMEFTRSVPVPYNDGCSIGYREQMNRVSSFIDGGMIYGDSILFNENLRGTLGCLRGSKGNLLPAGGMCHLNDTGDFCQLGGDERVNEVPSLGGLHVVWLRLHNIIAKQIRYFSKMSSPNVFLETKKIVGALLQQITYGEYLPLILSKKTRKSLYLDLKPWGYWKKYDGNVNPTVKNVVATAALRFGHSQIPKHLGLKTKKFAVDKLFNTEDVLMNPHIVVTKNGENLPGLTQFLLETPVKKVDRQIEDGVRNELFRDANGTAFDLPALNIQRGRDHGLPGYNAWRKWCKLPEASTFSCLYSHDPDVRKRLQNTYDHPDDIDVFVGGVTETPRDGALVGPLFECLLGHQFRDLKQGDRYWYETIGVEGFKYRQLQEIRKVSLSKILCETLGLKKIQKNAFSIPDDKTNPVVSCSSLPFIDFSKWTPRRSYG
ncbi:salivary peroxidase/catechol oxidase-like isoform X2 [Crassostrea virginica]